MSFLNSGLLYALAPLIALPLIIHLLNRRFPRLFYFSSVKRIRETMAQRSRLFRWRHLILLLLRTAFVVLLLMAFLKPFLDRFGPATAALGGRHVLLLLDHSLSMEFTGDGVSSRRRAILEAENILDTLGAEDRVNVVRVGHAPATCFVDFSNNHAEARRFVRQLPPGYTRADFNQANTVASRFASKTTGPVEIYYVSDFQRRTWANVNFSQLPSQARLFFVDVASVNKDNHGILGAALDQSQVLAGDNVALEITIGNFADKPLRDQVTVVLDQRRRFERDIDIAPWSVAKVTMQIPAGSPGLHLCEIRLPPDGLEADNRHFLAIDVLEKEEVLIISDDPNPERDAVYFLQTALNPFEDLRGSLLPRHIRSGEISPAQLASANKIFVTRSGRLTEEAAELLAKFLFGGGAVIYFCDGEFDAANVEALDRAMGLGVMPLKLGGRHVAETVATAQQIIRGEFRSKYLSLFRGPVRQDLALLEFYDFYHAGATGDGTVLLTYADESPAMAETGYGLGSLLLMNFSVSEMSSNLARQRIFPAWMQELVKAVSSEEPAPASWTIGQTVHTEVWRSELRDAGFRSPSGGRIEVRRESLGERTAISFVPEELGFYTLDAGRLLYALGVNPSAEESDLRAVDRALLPAQMGEEQQAHFVSGQADYEAVVQGRPLSHYFVLGAMLLLLLELGFQALVRRPRAVQSTA